MTYNLKLISYSNNVIDIIIKIKIALNKLGTEGNKLYNDDIC
jgi:hypothetical protein